MHSHLPIRHLIRSVEERRKSGEGQPTLPSTLTTFVAGICELFEPFTGVARAGYECMYGEDRWEVAVFLGATEAVGGAADGSLVPANFRFDVLELVRRFDRITSLTWNAIPNGHAFLAESQMESFLTVEGSGAGHDLSMQVHAVAPEAIGPAMRQYVDGRVELV